MAAGLNAPGPEERASAVALAMASGVSHSRRTALLQRFGSASGALAAPLAFLRTCPGMSLACATAIKATSTAEGARILKQVESHGGTALLPGDAHYPALLADIPEPPGVLFALGRLEFLALPAVAVVGSRDHSAYGAEACREVVAAAASAGLAVVSGMARGLDAVAHLAALDLDTPTIGILGNGFGVVYPAANRRLYERMRGAGLLLTEFPPGERPGPGSFQRRNRLISGLARVTVVVEAAAGSGTLITVEAALAQGRDVMAVPGPITSHTSIGTNRLLRDGATPFLERENLLELFPGTSRNRMEGPAPAPVADVQRAALSGAEARVYAAIGRMPRHLDGLAESLGLGAAELLATLATLELSGHVRQEPGRQFVRI